MKLIYSLPDGQKLLLLNANILEKKAVGIKELIAFHGKLQDLQGIKTASSLYSPFRAMSYLMVFMSFSRCP